MASILQECMGQSLTAENRRDGGPGYFFKGPVRLYHILDQSAREPASEEQVRGLAERFKPAAVESGASGPAYAEPERDETPRGRRPRRESPVEDEEPEAEADLATEPFAEADDSEPQTYSSGPTEGGASPFAALATLRASPAAVKAAKELGVDLGTITGTGRNGAITIGDVRNASAAAPIQ
ncbi:MAG: E3 binding domain-containing protein [Candidatus Terrybacteria bacterium]|nr:E3 binding domain-containing protein [Candidatus Terrybacteria bacterium]